jgi:hypothetical protein
MIASAPVREVHCADALAWLADRPVLAGCSIVTSLPDVSELPHPLEVWKTWFIDAARLLLERCPDDGLAIFYQTDIKRDGSWVDKGHLVQRAAECARCPLRWHKVVCRVPPGATSFGRPAWAHLLCFSRGVTVEPAQAIPDVITRPGAMMWSRAIPLGACRMAVRQVRSLTSSHTIVDPFCGVGTVLAVANELGLDAIGVDRSRRRCARARSLITAGR